ncbi:HalOD1 output domain-containing protein [Natrinema caseinilyticum]|uniref:HalOD1 output domain-containing protein n=1 Tax=Natrinema caseinilyticum TaxID=2961570 RepID=UPI0020C41CB2|nr:HalOD1 output domain-containing protein [Natrinema caseinilyticum]
MTDHHDGDSDRHSDKPGEQRYRTTFDPSSDLVSGELIRAVTTLTDTEPEELAVLADFVDSDALDALFRPLSDGTPRDSGGRVSFRYDDYVVRIQADGIISLHRSDGKPR